MSKDIEMNYKGGQEYEVIYPKSASNIILLSNAMNEFYGYENGTLDDALLQQLLGIGTYGYQIKVVYPDGSPVVGSTVSGITAISGRDLVTDENGVVLGTSESQSVTIGATSPCIDVKAASGISVQSTGILTDYTVQLEYETEIQLITSSQILTFSSRITSVDLCAVGAGGGSNNPGNHYLSSGGGGGYVQNLMAHQIQGELQIKIGSGTALDGGSTQVVEDSATILTANGGMRGNVVSYSENEDTGNIPGGVGNGNGGVGRGRSNFNTTSQGQDGTVYVFNDSSLGLPGGGGGGAMYSTRYDVYVYSKAGQSKGGVGSTYKPNPNEQTQRAQNGQIPGGGGGGVISNITSSPSYTSGGSGGVYIRFHH